MTVVVNTHTHTRAHTHTHTQWHTPPQLELTGEIHPRGVDSEERARQIEREGKVLAQLFLNKSRFVLNTRVIEFN